MNKNTQKSPEDCSLNIKTETYKILMSH